MIADLATPGPSTWCTSAILRTPKNRHQQTLSTIKRVAKNDSPKEDTIAPIPRRSHLAETALTTAGVEQIAAYNLLLAMQVREPHRLISGFYQKSKLSLGKL